MTVEQRKWLFGRFPTSSEWRSRYPHWRVREGTVEEREVEVKRVVRVEVVRVVGVVAR